MKSMIYEMIFQNSIFMEGIKNGKEYDAIMQERDKIYEKLVKTLDNEQCKLLEELVNSHIHLEAESSDYNFVIGFKSAVKLIIECFET